MANNRVPNEPQNYRAVIVGAIVAVIVVVFLVWMYSSSTSVNTSGMTTSPNTAISNNPVTPENPAPTTTEPSR